AADVFKLCLLALFDIHADTNHAQGNAAGITLNHTATLKQPSPTALLVADAVLRIVVVSFSGNVIPESARSCCHIVRMNICVPASNMVPTFTRLQVQPIAPVAVPARAVGAEVQLPQAHPRAPDGCFQPRLTRAQLALGTLLGIDVQRDTDRRGDLPL